MSILRGLPANNRRLDQLCRRPRRHRHHRGRPHRFPLNIRLFSTSERRRKKNIETFVFHSMLYEEPTLFLQKLLFSKFRKNKSYFPRKSSQILMISFLFPCIAAAWKRGHDTTDNYLRSLSIYPFGRIASPPPPPTLSLF